jgi:hypothetical protein
MEAFAVPFLLFVGALLALQAAANVQLSTATGNYPNAAGLERGSRQLADGVGKGTCEALQHPVVRRGVVAD